MESKYGTSERETSRLTRMLTQGLPAQLQTKKRQPSAEGKPQRTRRNHRGQPGAAQRTHGSASHELDQNQPVVLAPEEVQAPADKREKEAENHVRADHLGW